MHRLRLLPVLALLALAACGTPAPSDPGLDAGPAGRDASSCAKPCGSDCCVRGQVCDTKTDTCVAECLPDCDGRSCGDDGCGGVCGVCGPGTSCANGRCVACQPNCLGKQCGADGCGSLCGVCGTGLTCSSDGLCTVCQPSCTGKQCGPNGCGGVCGTCASGTACGTDGVCRATGACNGNGDCASTPATPVCDTATRTCVACTANTHCQGATPVCDLGTKQCVTCTASAGCASGLVCDLTVPGGRCTGCLSSANCSGATPVCDTATHACVACTAAEGCTSEGKVCDTGVAGGRCVQCLTTLNCGSGRFCDTATKSCVICTTTQGCTAPQTCDTTVPGGRCTGCSVDAQCASTPATPICDSSTARCVTCTAARGCVAPQSCDTTVTGGRCVGCTMHADCLAPTPACDPSTARCVTCTASYGCSGATPKCKTGASPVCVACLSNADCTGGKTCNTATNTCFASTNVSQQIATARSQPDGLTYSLPINGALVTYVRPAAGSEPAGYFIQGDQAGPALLVEDVATLPAVGDRVSFTITALGSPASAAFVGTRTVQVLTGFVKESSGNPVTGLLQDLSSVSAVATAPANYESEYVALRGVLGASAAADSGFVKFPMATAGNPTTPQPFLRLHQTQAGTLDLTAGCTVQLKAGVLAVSRGGETQAQASGYRESDFTVVSCPAPRVRLAVAASPTRVLVNFDRQIKASSVTLGAFSIAGLSVSAASLSGPRQVALTTNVQLPGQAYVVNVAQTVTDTLGTPLASGATTATFQGFVTGTLGPSNPGFESWASPSAAISWTPGVGVIVGQETTNRHGGSYAARLIRNSTVNAENEIVGTLIPVQEGANYRVSAWFYDEDANGKGNLGYSFLSASGGVLSTQFATGFTADTAAWQELVVNTVPAPAGAVSLKLMLRVYAQNLPTGGAVLVDDADVRAVANEPVALTGDFERWVSSTTAEGWTAASGILVAQDSTVKHGGTYSAKLTRNSTTNSLVELSSGGLQVLAGTTYRLGMWFLDNNVNARANLGYAWHDSSNVQVGVVYGAAYTADGVGWQELTLVTDPAPANAASIRVFTRVYGQTGGTPTGGFVNLDDVTLTAQ